MTGNQLLTAFEHSELEGLEEWRISGHPPGEGVWVYDAYLYMELRGKSRVSCLFVATAASDPAHSRLTVEAVEDPRKDVYIRGCELLVTQDWLNDLVTGLIGFATEGVEMAVIERLLTDAENSQG